MFHKQHCLCLRGHSTDRKLYAHPLFILPTEITQIICLEGHRCLKSVMHVSHANEPGTWGGGGSGALPYLRERRETIACKGCLRLQLHFNAVLSLFTRGHQRSGFSLSTCWLICSVHSGTAEFFKIVHQKMWLAVHFLHHLRPTPTTSHWTITLDRTLPTHCSMKIG